MSTPERTIVITGASDGIGAAAAGQLQRRGHRVVVVGRSEAKTAAVAAPLGADHHTADFADLSQVRELADTLARHYPRIDVLANNAGGVIAEHTITADGHEATLQINHLAGYLLTRLLLPQLQAGAGIVVQSASQAARAGALDPTTLNVEGRQRYRAMRSYSQAKLANILFTRELHRRHHGDGIAAVAFHPGVVASNFGSSGSAPVRALYRFPVFRALMTGVEEGGSRLTWLADGEPGQTWQPGAYYQKNKVAGSHRQADDPAIASWLWERSEQWVEEHLS